MTIKRSDRARAHLSKTRAELARLEADGVLMVGNAFSPLLFCKGRASAAEKNGADPFCGADGTALRASLVALGYAPEHWAGLATWDNGGAPLDAELLRRAVLALDPATVVACDDEAAQALCAAFVTGDLQVPGQVWSVCGMRMIGLGGFEDALGDSRSKQLMWARLKLIPPLGAPY
ncbi:MAG: hypothetical protein Q4A01_03020 [Coriobacteriales bacterium]|nr:hypothetical protein [Coriobacteriales bacterium]